MKEQSSKDRKQPAFAGKTRLHARSLIWIGLTILLLILNRVIPDPFFERWYYEGIFRWVRSAYDLLLGWSPIPMIYLVIIVILVRTVRWANDWKYDAVFQISRAVGGIAAVIFLFYALWGFNYHQASLQDRLAFDLDDVTKDDIDREFLRATEVLRKEAMELPEHYTSDGTIISLPVTDHSLRPEVEKALTDLGVPHTGNVRVRQLWPNGFLMRWGTAGIYIPHAFEGHIDKGMLSVQKPFSIAHEMAHGYGVTDEGACNFVAWLACSQSRDKWIRFGGALTYWRYAAAEVEDEKVNAVIHTFDPVVMRSLLLIRENDKKYPDLMPRLRDAIYSSYLKRHGVKGGLRSYNYVVKMVHQYVNAKGDEPSIQ